APSAPPSRPHTPNCRPMVATDSPCVRSRKLGAHAISPFTAEVTSAPPTNIQMSVGVRRTVPEAWRKSPNAVAATSLASLVPRTATGTSRTTVQTTPTLTHAANTAVSIAGGRPWNRSSAPDRAAPASELGDQGLRGGAVARFAHPYQRPAQEQLPEATHRRTEHGAGAPQAHAERDHRAPRLQVSQHAERQREQGQHDDIGGSQPPQLLVGENELPLDRLEQGEDDVAIGVVEEADEREQTEGIRRVRPGRDRGSREFRVCGRQSSPPRGRRAPPSPRGTPR